MISIRSNHISLKYQRFTPSGCKDIGNRKVFGKNSIPLPIAVIKVSKIYLGKVRISLQGENKSNRVRCDCK